MPLVTDAVQLAGFLLAGWLLFRFSDWIYRRGASQGASDRTTVADLAPPPTDESAAVQAIVTDHGEHGRPSPAQLLGDDARRDGLRDARRHAPAEAERH
jgi:hypothetical protein